ncbi:hypothetical protein ABVK25_007921 [Lepraria finkii]|uniref:Uncharacterized protein n=1 Tax=Lepraria finkii TaxID=1340010 RepID=A0ABR4B2G1_9LECA
MHIIAMAWRITGMEEFIALMYSTELSHFFRGLRPTEEAGMRIDGQPPETVKVILATIFLFVTRRYSQLCKAHWLASSYGHVGSATDQRYTSCTLASIKGLFR